MISKRIISHIRILQQSKPEAKSTRFFATALNDVIYPTKLYGAVNTSFRTPFSTYHPNRIESDILERYKDKLKKKAESKGIDSVDDLLKEHYEKEKEYLSKKKENQKTKEVKKNQKIQRKETNDPSLVSLDKIMKVEKLKELDAEAISKLWNAFHAKKECLSAAFPSSTYSKLLQRFKECPYFLLPIPREEGGHEFYFMQSHYHQVYFTSLIEYKTHGSQARPHLIITHYPELSKDKDIVLMKGELGNSDKDYIPLELDDAKMLTLLLQQFYLIGGDAKWNLVIKFNKDPSNFDHNELLAEAAKL